MILKNISRYHPNEMPYGAGVIYFKSEDGNDFYESLPFFTKKYKLCIEPLSGIVCSCDEDASKLYPNGFTVVEVDSLPEGFDISGEWIYNAGQVERRAFSQSDNLVIAENKKNVYREEANNIITPLQDAVDLDIATEQEQQKLAAWKKYRVLLNRVDTSKAPDIEWPKAPD
jgi:hypothetical protein